MRKDTFLAVIDGGGERTHRAAAASGRGQRQEQVAYSRSSMA
jgi:hypothetical protein